MKLVGEGKGWIAVCGEEQGISAYPQTPASDADDEIKETSRETTGKEDGEPGNNHTDYGGNPEEHQDDPMRYGQQPFHQRQPAVELVLGIGISYVDVYRLLFISGRIDVSE